MQVLVQFNVTILQTWQDSFNHFMWVIQNSMQVTYPFSSEEFFFEMFWSRDCLTEISVILEHSVSEFLKWLCFPNWSLEVSQGTTQDQCRLPEKHSNTTAEQWISSNAVALWMSSNARSLSKPSARVRVTNYYSATRNSLGQKHNHCKTHSERCGTPEAKKQWSSICCVLSLLRSSPNNLGNYNTSCHMFRVLQKLLLSK